MSCAAKSAGGRTPVWHMRALEKPSVVEARERMSGSAPCAPLRRDGTAMRVLAVEPASGLARCAGTDAVAETVETALVAPVEPGDIVLVHAGVALLRLDAEWSP